MADGKMRKKMLGVLVILAFAGITALALLLLQLKDNSQRFSQIEATVAGVVHFTRAVQPYWRAHPELREQKNIAAETLADGLLPSSWPVEEGALRHPMGGSVTATHTRAQMGVTYTLELADVPLEGCPALAQQLAQRLPELVPPQTFSVNGQMVRERLTLQAAREFCQPQNIFKIIVAF